MTQKTAAMAHGGRRRGAYHRWTPAKKAAFLEAFQESGLTGLQFCRERGIPPSTFDLWKREAREQMASELPARSARGAEVGSSFARVRVVSADRVAAAEEHSGRSGGEPSDTGVTIVLRGAGGHAARLFGVDGATTLRVIELVLGGAR